MERLTRRTLFKRASVSVGLAGLVATTAACASDGGQSANAASTVQAAGTSLSQLTSSNEPLAVFVTDPARGTLLLVRGDNEATITNLDLARAISALQ